eukprot:jgi/Psemu1/30409/gm1.30409_g
MPINLTLEKGIMLEESSPLNLFTLMTGIVYLHDALEGKKGSICYRWTEVDTLHSPEIAPKMSWYQWRQIKSNLKLNCNHEARYNRLLCKDDMNKFIYAYKFDSFMKLSFTMSITSARRHAQACDIFTKYVIPEIGKLWSSPPHLTADNLFNSDLILDWMGGLGFGRIGTVAQNRLPKTVEDKYVHKENVSSTSAKRCSRVARLCNPVTMVKEMPACAEAGSTGACNIGFVNSLDSNGFFMHQKENQIDSAILRSNIGCKSWKYYHAPINHAKALAVLTAFDMYQELTDGTHSQFWLLPKRQQLDFRHFKQKSAEQMLAYN